MKKFLVITGLVLALATVVNANSADAKTKVITEKQAAKKVAAACKKAYTTKKTVTVTFKIKGDCLSNNFQKKVAKIEWGEYAVGGSAAGNTYDNYNNYTVASYPDFPTHSLVWKSKNGVTTVKEEISYSEVKKEYSNFPYWKKIVDHLKSATKNMSQVEKAAYVDSWLGARLGYHWATSDGQGDVYKCATPKRIWKGTAYGQCEVRADLYAVFAKIAGVKHVATVHIPEINHLASAVRFEDGRIFTFNLGEIMNGRWEIEERVAYANQYIIENNTGEPEETAESLLYYIFDTDDVDNVDTDAGKKYYSWYGENKSETFTAKQYTKGPIYSKFAW